jgi:response regulator NasT
MTQSKPRLLVVDDDRIVLSSLVAGLTRAGFDVVVATNGDEARRMAVDVQPALVVLDAEMDSGNGLDAAEFLARDARIPFLVVAPVRNDRLQQRAAACGAVGVVAKPVDLTKLVPAIRAALERAGSSPRAAEEASLLADALGGAHGPQALIALGILVERHKVNCDEAVRMLRQRSAAEGRPVDEAALAIIEQAERATRPPV